MGINDYCSHRYYFAAILLGVEPTEENIREITKIYPTLSELQKDMSRRGLVVEKDYMLFAIGDVFMVCEDAPDIVYEHILNRLKNRRNGYV